MKIQDKYYLMKIEDYYIVLPMQESITKEKTTLTLNEKEAFLWHHLKNNATEDELTTLLAQKYGTDENSSRRTVKIFIRELVDSKIIIEFP